MFRMVGHANNHRICPEEFSSLLTWYIFVFTTYQLPETLFSCDTFEIDVVIMST